MFHYIIIIDVQFKILTSYNKTFILNENDLNTFQNG